MDGVLIDNRKFELAVHQQIIEAVAARSRDSADAARRWEARLAAARRDFRWYDYELHAISLGVPGAAEAAHRRMRHLLKRIDGAEATVRTIVECGGHPVVVTDAAGWVSTLKLEATGLASQLSLRFTTTSQRAAKTEDRYWLQLRRSLAEMDLIPALYIDNRASRLSAFESVFGLVPAVLFDHPEHLEAGLARGSHLAGDSGRVVVRDHSEVSRLVEAAAGSW